MQPLPRTNSKFQHSLVLHKKERLLTTQKYLQVILPEAKFL